jgi:hypothetical protein
MTDGTKRAPDYLVGDILLGKRRRPSFAVVPTTQGRDATYSERILLKLRVENHSIVHADEVRCGLVSLSDDEPADDELPGLAPFLTVQANGKTYHNGSWRVRHQIVSADGRVDLWPFSHATYSFHVRRPASKTGWHLKAALYALPKRGSPQWFQVEVIAKPDYQGFSSRERGARLVDFFPWSCSVTPSKLPLVEMTLGVPK